MAKKVLIVDDDSTVRELYEEVLKDEGFEVETAADGEEGLTKITEGGYNLILLDIMMPKLDGIGILTSLSEKQPKIKNGPIILLTNLAHDPQIEEALKMGAKAALIKADLTPLQFVEKIKTYLPI
ncbi:response regulator [Candidatus Woesebacteria bacterium]|nr:response regulator [Candidatus Woesebacteria bacterium]